jgi:hypothetical protein
MHYDEVLGILGPADDAQVSCMAILSSIGGTVQSHGPLVGGARERAHLVRKVWASEREAVPM